MITSPDSARAAESSLGWDETAGLISSTMAACAPPVEDGSPVEDDPPVEETPATAALCAAVGSLLSTVALQPLELVKVHMQASVGADSGVASSASAVLLHIVREDGALGLLRGTGPVVLRSVSTDALYFWCLAKVKRAYAAACKQTARAADSSEGTGGERVQAPLSVAEALALGVLSGWLTRAVTQPIEVVTTRLLLNPSASLRSVIVKLYSEGGLRGFWRGFALSLLLALNPALQYTVYERALAWLKAWRTDPKRVSDRALSAPLLFLLGMLTRSVTLPTVYPLIRAKTRLQATGDAGVGVLGTFAEIVRVEGLLGLYTGLSAQLGKSVLSTALLLTTKEKTAQLLDWLSARPHPKRIGR